MRVSYELDRGLSSLPLRKSNGYNISVLIDFKDMCGKLWTVRLFLWTVRLFLAKFWAQQVA